MLSQGRGKHFEISARPSQPALERFAAHLLLARELRAGSVDGIVAGHTHAGLAHEVAGIPIVQSYWGGRSFGRIDLLVDRETGRVRASTPFAPRDICLHEDPSTRACVAT